MQRATLVGEVTGGGANPVTGSNWEHVGVKPDVPVPAADALKFEHTTLLRTLVADSKDPGELEWLQDMLAAAESGVVTPVDYSRMR